MPILLVFLSIIVVAVVMNWIQELTKKRRIQALKAQAEELGFTFSNEGNPNILSGLEKLLLFAQGKPTVVKNVMRAQIEDFDVTLFEYGFATPWGRYIRTWPQTIALFRSDRLVLPEFTLCPTDILDVVLLNILSRERREAVLGTAGIRIAAHLDFSERYRLMGSDRTAIEALFGGAVMAHYARVAPVCTESTGQELIYYRMHKQLPAKAIKALLNEGLALIRLLVESQ